MVFKLENKTKRKLYFWLPIFFSICGFVVTHMLCARKKKIKKIKRCEIFRSEPKFQVGSSKSGIILNGILKKIVRIGRSLRY